MRNQLRERFISFPFNSSFYETESILENYHRMEPRTEKVGREGGGQGRYMHYGLKLYGNDAFILKTQTAFQWARERVAERACERMAPNASISYEFLPRLKKDGRRENREGTQGG